MCCSKQINQYHTTGLALKYKLLMKTVRRQPMKVIPYFVFCIIQICSGITHGRVLNWELYTQIF